MNPLYPVFLPVWSAPPVVGNHGGDSGAGKGTGREFEGDIWMSDEKKTNSTEEEQEPIEQLPIKEEFELRKSGWNWCIRFCMLRGLMGDRVFGLCFGVFQQSWAVTENSAALLLFTCPFQRGGFVHCVLCLPWIAMYEDQSEKHGIWKGTRRHHLCKYLEYLWHRGFHLGCFDDRPSLPSCYSGKCLYYRGCSIFFNHLKVSRGIPCEVCKLTFL